MSGEYRQRGRLRSSGMLPYVRMSIDEIAALPINDISETGCHLWLWTTNSFLKQGFELMSHWGFTYLAPIHWIKPSGRGNWVIHRTQTILLGYKEKCRFDLRRYFPNIINANPGVHSQKPRSSYDLIMTVSKPPRLEMFARNKRIGWDVWGDEVKSTIEMPS